ncbi:hypothetical protein [Anaerotalea alkaliphila]|uniref:hypothetical protein n=1 Tax=Anaerotalea alkaliphila TaxID=2662126 RepID=UPI001BA7D5DD|nr:hypothetical protein [Anaerotalea alkaliphila]
MINFDEELDKFKPALELEEVEDAIYAYASKDITEILDEMVQELKKEREKQVK